jgi:hypothetical protein
MFLLRLPNLPPNPDEPSRLMSRGDTKEHKGDWRFVR